VKRLLVFLSAVALCCAARGQMMPPQISFTGNFGCIGFPCQNAGTLIFPTDANYTASALEGSVQVIKLTSSVSLTAARSLILPSVTLGWGYWFYNETTGTQTINICGPSGTCAAIPHDSYAHWAGSDGTNFYTLPGAGCTPTLTTTGTSGAATLTGCAFNIPQYVTPSGAYLLLNPSATQNVVQASGTSYGFSEQNTANAGINFDGTYLQSLNAGWNNGYPFAGNSDWTTVSVHSGAAGFMSATAGISQYEHCLMTHTAEGDSQCAYDYFHCFGNLVNGNDEGCTYRAAHVYQLGMWWGPVTSATAGANATTLLTTSGPYCYGGTICSELAYNSTQFAVGGWMVDQSTGVSGPYTISAYTPNIDGADEYTLSSGTVTPSTALGTVVSCTSSVQGKFGVYGTQNCTVNVFGGTNAGGFTTSSHIVRIGPGGTTTGKEEEDVVTSVGTIGSPSAGEQTMVLQSQWPFAAGDFIGQGGPAGQLVGPNNANISTVDLVGGALDSTHIFFGHCVKGGCAGAGGNVIQPNAVTAGVNLSRSGGTVTATPTSNFSSLIYLAVGSTITVTGAVPSDLNGTFTIASTTGNSFNPIITWTQSGSTETSSTAGTIGLPLPKALMYYGAMICGTNNGTTGNANLCTNSATWNTSDAAIGAESNEVSLNAYQIYIGQISGFDSSYPSGGISVTNTQPQGIGWDYQCANTYAALDASCVDIVGNYADDIVLNTDPINNGAIIYDANGGHSTIPFYLFQRGNSYFNMLVNPAGAGTLTFGNGGSTLVAGGYTVGATTYTGTTVAATNCGSLSGSAGCIEVIISGVTHYVPYW